MAHAARLGALTDDLITAITASTPRVSPVPLFFCLFYLDLFFILSFCFSILIKYSKMPVS